MSAGPFRRALDPVWERLPAELRAFHDIGAEQRYVGCAEVTRGKNPLARLAASLFRFPPEARDLPVTIVLRPDGDAEIWERDFGGSRLPSRVTYQGPGRVRERMGPARFELALTLGQDQLRVTVVRGWLLGLPMPRVLLPRSDAAERGEGGRFHFDIGLSLPVLGPMVRYRGWLRPEEPA